MIVSFKRVQQSYATIEQHLKQLHAEKRRLALHYHDLRDALLHGGAVDKVAFNSVVKGIHSLEEEIDKLQHHKKTTMEAWLGAQSTSDPKDDELHSSYDPTLPSIRAKAFMKTVAESRAGSRNLGNLVLSKYQFIEQEGAPQAERKRTPTPTETATATTVVPKKKKPVKKLTTEQVTNVAHSIKELIAKTYRFKDKTECISKQRTKPFYASKDDILSAIESTPELKKLMPANYKKLTKDKLCEVFFEHGSH